LKISKKKPGGKGELPGCCKVDFFEKPRAVLESASQATINLIWFGKGGSGAGIIGEGNLFPSRF
jgi:hypothetical protein